LTVPCRALANAGINIKSLSLADTSEFGILRIIVKDWQKSVEVLETAGCLVKTNDVVAVEVEDKPGGLVNILDVMESNGINVEYMYAFAYGCKEHAALIFRFEDIDKALTVLEQNNIGFIEPLSLFNDE
ncbi:MAG: amino acid-binding protein, partial [Lentisphaerae bacterium]|nr:amino acid-binding protein [Lentisphaerota bacterium]